MLIHVKLNVCITPIARVIDHDPISMHTNKKLTCAYSLFYKHNVVSFLTNYDIFQIF
jgi:hypothetical protein